MWEKVMMTKDIITYNIKQLHVGDLSLFNYSYIDNTAPSHFHFEFIVILHTEKITGNHKVLNSFQISRYSGTVF